MAVRESAPNVAVSWGQLLSASAEIFDRYRFFYYPIPTATDPAWMESFGRLITIASSLREYTIASKEDLIEAWDRLREDRQLLDLILSVTGDILIETNWAVDEIAKKLVDAIRLPISSNDYSMVDDAFQGSLGERGELLKIFIANPWFMTLFLLRRSGKLNLTRPITTPPAAAPETP